MTPLVGIKLFKEDSLLIECDKAEYFELFYKFQPFLRISQTSTFCSERPYSINYRLLAHSFKKGIKTVIAAECDVGYTKYYKNKKFE